MRSLLQKGLFTYLCLDRLRVTKTMLFYMYLSSVLALENVALLKPAMQSSVYAGSTADKAVDGNTDGNRYNGYCSGTNQMENSWWKVDLMGLYTISHVELFNRVDGWTYRLQNFEIRVSSRDPLTFPSKDGKQCVYYTSIVPINGYTLNCTQPITGRYVSIFKAADEHLTICEIRVFGERAFTGSFRKAQNNFRFSSPVVTSLPVLSSVHCTALCLRSDNCSAFSFEQVLVSGKSSCDLAGYTQFVDQPPMVSLSGWSVYIIV
ncbi:fucolectin-like [Pomacea canaliculata]|uniref:fucolectin-like n=1 Tax=Pomacea canaliculata TaxID=400727 RepID=UPI000D7337C9|nr:fucolectin-like [Pomacea canaliculata]XP_025079991.1 fucolectin-like [Pomacea canaliculata]XP_025079992.1 fucolectin-like [Pomacea canaliculata]